ncbi:MAG TPA: GNAT family N-acetyltransferase [bacterium]|nr:GNAT family N-acetyltransferase [bacterium]HPR87049.1 GNAT family N-acetyltransferase [bacterium]
MIGHPVLQTERILLRPFQLADAAEVQRLAGDFAIADTTASIPHPYPDGAAEKWIEGYRTRFEEGKEVVFAIVLREGQLLAGAIGLHHLDNPGEVGELGYWIGVPYWGRGYCTEAAAAVIAYGFAQLQLQRIYACHFRRNPASGRVMAKNGMAMEGCLRRHFKRHDTFEDLVYYGILREEWLTRRNDRSL